jgi:hypothetical protein
MSTKLCCIVIGNLILERVKGKKGFSAVDHSVDQVDPAQIDLSSWVQYQEEVDEFAKLPKKSNFLINGSRRSG